MRKLILLQLVLFFSITNASAQHTFVRLYNQQKKLIAKGKLLMGNDSTIELKNGADSASQLAFPISQVAYIKTKHTAAHSLLWGSVVTGGSFALLGLAAGSGGSTQCNGYGSDCYGASSNTGEDVAAGLIVGSVLGGVTGTIIGVTKHRETFKINGNSSSWINARKKILGLD